MFSFSFRFIFINLFFEDRFDKNCIFFLKFFFYKKKNIKIEKPSIIQILYKLISNNASLGRN
jgi:hypothetical protein